MPPRGAPRGGGTALGVEFGSIDGIVRRLTSAMSRRRFGALAAGLALGAPVVASAGKKKGKGTSKRCLKRLDACAKSSQRRGRPSRCATSHGSGSNTCCGGEGATCGSDLTCCVPLTCEGGRCVMAEPV